MQQSLHSRRVLKLSGKDRSDFLQGLVTNDVRRLCEGPLHAALLTPQGKYLADFFLVEDGDSILIDVAEPLADALKSRLSMYRLRSDVEIGDTDLGVETGLGPPPPGAFADPRLPALGWRRITPAPAPPDPEEARRREALRVAHCVPESLIELIPGETYILEAGFERLNGVDFRKGCYVGQEVTARMKHKTELRKGLATVEIEGEAPVGTPIIGEGGRRAGTLYSQAEGKAIAHLRFERAKGEMRAGPARLWLSGNSRDTQTP